jgi:DNA-binding NarL/FixJ family response regulator
MQLPRDFWITGKQAMNTYAAASKTSIERTDAQTDRTQRQSLQPMFVTNKTLMSEVDAHLDTVEDSLVVVTIEQGNTRGESMVQHIGSEYPQAKIVLVCEGGPAEILKLAFMRGVQGCVSRQSSVETLRAAIDEVSRGHRFLAQELSKPTQSSVASFMERQILARDKPVIATKESEVALTRREKQVLTLIAQGKPRREIAEGLKVSPRTIDAYRARLLQKLNLDSSVQLVKYAFSIGLIAS